MVQSSIPFTDYLSKPFHRGGRNKWCTKTEILRSAIILLAQYFIGSWHSLLYCLFWESMELMITFPIIEDCVSDTWQFLLWLCEVCHHVKEMDLENSQTSHWGHGRNKPNQTKTREEICHSLAIIPILMPFIQNISVILWDIFLSLTLFMGHISVFKQS